MKKGVRHIVSMIANLFERDWHPSREMLRLMERHAALQAQPGLPRTFRTQSIKYLGADGTGRTFPLRTVFSWKSRGQDDPFADDEDAAYRRYLDTTDGVCALLCLSPTFNAAMRGAPALERYTVGFAPVSIKTFGSFSPHDSQNVRLADHLIDREDGPAGKDGLQMIPWIVAHEMRHGVQYLKGPFFPGPLNIHDANLHSRINEADSCAFQTTVAWELQALGHDAPWRALLARPKYGAIARAFHACAAQDAGAVDSGMAASAAFSTWFASRALRGIYDRGACKPVIRDLKGLAAVWPHMDPAYRIFEEVRPVEDHIWRAVLRARSAMPFVNAAGGLSDRPHYLDSALAAATLSPANRSFTDKRPLRRVEALNDTLRAMAARTRPVLPQVHYTG